MCIFRHIFFIPNAVWLYLPHQTSALAVLMRLSQIETIRRTANLSIRDKNNGKIHFAGKNRAWNTLVELVDKWIKL